MSSFMTQQLKKISATFLYLTLSYGIAQPRVHNNYDHHQLNTPLQTLATIIIKHKIKVPSHLKNLMEKLYTQTAPSDEEIAEGVIDALSIIENNRDKIDTEISTHLTTTFADLVQRKLQKKPFKPTATPSDGSAITQLSNPQPGSITNTSFPDNNLQQSTGTNNTALGYNNLSSNTTGRHNTSIGSTSLNLNSSGNQNVAIGSYALHPNTTGNSNTALGFNTLSSRSNRAGTNNTALGAYAGSNIWEGSNNIHIGSTGEYYDENTIRLGSSDTHNYCYIAGIKDTPISGKVVAIDTTTGQLGTTTGGGGADLTYGATVGQNIYLPQSSSTQGAIYIHNAPFVHAAGDYYETNTFVGRYSGNFETTSDHNTGIGFHALKAVTSGSNNTAVGDYALSNIAAGNYNTAVGDGALANTDSGVHNTACGASSLGLNEDGGHNTAYGSFSLFENTAGSNNTAIGNQASYKNVNGYENTAIGDQALHENQSGKYNVAVGNAALYKCLGDYNIGIGAFNYNGNSITSGNNNICLGNTGHVNDSGIMRLGTTTTHTGCFIAGISGTTVSSGSAVYVNTMGQLGTITSSQRYKNDINLIGKKTAGLMSLKPVSFTYKQDASRAIQYGLIAEEVETVYPELVLRNTNNQIETVAYHHLPALLLAGYQQQQEVIAGLTQRLEKLEKDNRK